MMSMIDGGMMGPMIDEATVTAALCSGDQFCEVACFTEACD